MTGISERVCYIPLTMGNTLITSQASAEIELFERFLAERATRMPASDLERLRRVFQEAVDLYGQQTHWTGEKLITHCMGVLTMFLSFEPDDEAVIACLLHHVLDTKLWSLDELEKRYGASVRSIVSGVHLLSHVTMKNRRMSLENLRLMFLRVSDDIRIVLLILCDHTYKMEHVDMLPPEARRTICRDALQLFAPVAARLGIYSLKHHLETRAFPMMYPVDSARISEQLAQLHERHGAFLEQASKMLKQFLKEGGVEARVEGREKQPYSIFQKMKGKSVTHVEDVYDLFALRVIVKDEAECYQTLGLLHRIGHPVMGRFKDYIAFPKPNGYQSLHTTLVRLPGVPDNVFIEVQIRTEGMHREADLGIAAHWSYKEGGSAELIMRKNKLHQALSFQQPLEDRVSQSFADHIFALTPNGDIIELPEGSTPLDFAFTVHSMIGLCFKAARVNGVIVPLSYQLENGDIVEILKHREPHPSPNWLYLLKTSAAKSRLKRYLVAQDRPNYVMMGKEALNAELARQHLPSLDPDLSLLREVDGVHLNQSEREDQLMKIGQGAMTAFSFLSHIDALKGVLPQQSEQKTVIASETAIAKVDGNIPMPVRFARCCKPDEGKRSAIVGVIGRNGEVRVHRTGCKMTRAVNPERRIGVRWVEK